jgi:hypothetical protein
MDEVFIACALLSNDDLIANFELVKSMQAFKVNARLSMLVIYDSDENANFHLN